MGSRLSVGCRWKRGKNVGLWDLSREMKTSRAERATVGSGGQFSSGTEEDQRSSDLNGRWEPCVELGGSVQTKGEEGQGGRMGKATGGRRQTRDEGAGEVEVSGVSGRAAPGTLRKQRAGGVVSWKDCQGQGGVWL